jgi:hypothetical protein
MYEIVIFISSLPVLAILIYGYFNKCSTCERWFGMKLDYETHATVNDEVNAGKQGHGKLSVYICRFCGKTTESQSNENTNREFDQ